MDLDALRRTAELLAPQVDPATIAVDQEQTLEEEFDDLGQGWAMQDVETEAESATEDAGEPIEGEVVADQLQVDDEQLAAILAREIERAKSDTESDAQNRSTALDYYFGRQPAQTAPKRSGVVSKDVADMVEAMLAQVLQAFSGHALANFPPANEEDEKQAEEESQYLNWVFSDDCDGQYLLYCSLKDAMIQATGIGKVYWDERTRITFDEYHNLTPMEISQALQPRHEGEQVEVIGYEEGEPQPMPVDPAQVQMMQMQGVPPPPPQQMPTINVRIRRRWSESKPVLASVDPNDFLYTPTHDSLFLEDIPFCADRQILTESTLLDMGFDEETVRALDTYYGDSESDKAATSKLGEATNFPSPEHRSTRPIEVYECYYLIDRDGDGFAERIKAFYSGGKVLRAEEHDVVPYALACPFPLPHRVVGESVFDKIKSVQDTKTALLRIAIDNALVNTFGRYEAEERMVNLNDLLHPVPGGVVRSKRIGSVAALAMANIGDAPMNLMSYMDKVRSEGAGPALDMQRENLPVNVQTAHGTERVMSAMEQLVSRIAQSFADTFVSEIFRLLHQLLMKHGKGELTARMPNGQYLVTNPRNWRERERVTITIGKTMAEKARAAMALTATIQYQTSLMQNGGNGILVDLSKVHNALIDWGRASNLITPEQYWIDPSSPESMQAQQAQAQAAQQQAAQQQQQMQMLLQLQLQMQQIQEESKRLKAQLDYQSSLAKVASDGMQNAQNNAVKLTDMELKYAQQADAEYAQNVRTMAQSQQRPTNTARPR